MGCPISATLSASLHALKLLNILNFKCWLKDVHDTFISTANSINLSSVLNSASSIDLRIQFTAETENNCKLFFLDVLVARFKSHFKNSVIRKRFDGFHTLWRITLLNKKGSILHICVYIVHLIFVRMLIPFLKN